MSSRIIVAFLELLLALQVVAQQPGSKPPTLREEAKRHGSIRSVYRGAGFPLTMDQVLDRASVIIVGKIVADSSHLSESEYSVLTDYKVRVITVLKDTSGQLVPGSIVTLTQLGGVTSVDGNTIEQQDPDNPLVKSSAPHLFIASRSREMLKVYPAGTMRFTNGHAMCHSVSPQSFRDFCGKGEEELLDTIKTKLSQKK
ncbi:MAG TPA: hypothetical protein VEC99_09420 [Clostridia bacterium]|nr:hypothetical protein [Clostridia bacterium]